MWVPEEIKLVSQSTNMVEESRMRKDILYVSDIFMLYLIYILLLRNLGLKSFTGRFPKVTQIVTNEISLFDFNANVLITRLLCFKMECKGHKLNGR